MVFTGAAGHGTGSVSTGPPERVDHSVQKGEGEYGGMPAGTFRIILFRRHLLCSLDRTMSLRIKTDGPETAVRERAGTASVFQNVSSAAAVRNTAVCNTRRSVVYS